MVKIWSELVCWLLGHRLTEGYWVWWEPFVTHVYCSRCCKWLEQ